MSAILVAFAASEAKLEISSSQVDFRHIRSLPLSATKLRLMLLRGDFRIAKPLGT